MQASGKPHVGYRVNGSAETLGARGTFTANVRLDGRICFVVDADLPEGLSWDGRRATAMGVTGIPRTIHEHERSLTLLEWMVMTERWPALADRAQGQADERLETPIRLRLETVEADLFLGPDGHPHRLEFDAPGGHHVTTYEGWRRLHDMTFPVRMETVVAGIVYRRLEVESIEPVNEAWRCSFETPSDVRFDPAVGPDLEVRRAATGHVLVQPRFEGNPAGWFILDTGGGPGVIDRRQAQALQLRQVGRGPISTPAGVEAGEWYRVDGVSIGPMTIASAPFVGMDLSYLAGPLGVPISGILGYGLLGRVVAEIETAESAVRLWNPATYESNGAWHTLKLVDLVPVLEGKFPEGTGDFRLDIGAGGPAGGVIFHTPAVRRFGLDAEEAEVASGEADASLPARPVRLAWFELAGHRYEDVAGLLWLSPQGALNDPHVVGNVGLDLLDELTIVLDYGRERFRLERK